MVLEESDTNDGALPEVDIQELGSSTVSIPDGLSSRGTGGVEQPGTGTQRQEPEEQFDIVETDDDFNPINGRGIQQRADGGQIHQDDSLSAEELEGGTFVERQQQDADGTRRQYSEDRRSRRQRQGAANQRTRQENVALKQQIADLAAQVAGLAPRFAQLDHAQIRNQIDSLDRESGEWADRVAVAKSQMSEAFVNSDPDAFNAALDARDVAMKKGDVADVRLHQLKVALSAAEQALQAGGQPQFDGRPIQAQQQAGQRPVGQPRAFTPEVIERITEWQNDNPWFDRNLNSSDPDTVTVRRIDQAVANAGYDPGTDEYWDMVEDLAAKALPHRFSHLNGGQRQQQPAPRNGASNPAPRNGGANGGRMAAQPQNQNPQRRGPPVAGSSDRAPAAPGRNQVLLSPGRKQALIDAGVLDRDGRTATNPDKLRSMLKQYAQFDRENGVGR